jgi:sugar O-acyltransferase (sialic acid O-acetyltransferase NeuD family)
MGPRKLVIFGTEAIARMAHFYFTRASDYEVCAFTADREYLRANSFCDLPVVAFEEVADRYPPSQHSMFVAIGYTKMNKLREARYHAAKELGYSLANFISPRCSFLTDHPIGDNCLIMEDNTIQPFVQIGNDVIMWSGNHVGHDAVIEDHCFLTSHVVVSGFTRIGRNSFLGVNATLRDAITIAPETLVGAGAVIMKDTVEKGVYLPPRAVLFDKKSDEITIS